MGTDTVAVAESASVAKKIELQNSHWVRDPAGKLGMIGEINSGMAQVHYLTDAGLASEFTVTHVDNLSLCAAADVPKSLGLTDQELADIGYA